MNLDIVKKILTIILGIAILIAFCFLFFYIVVFALIAGLIYYIYRRFFKKKPKTYNEDIKKKTINNVIIDAEYTEKD